MANTKFFYLVLIILTIIGAMLRILAANYNNLWNDEFHTLRFSTQDNLKEFFSDSFLINNNNPLYFLISHIYFQAIPPTSKLIIRFPALLFGILSIPLLFFTVRKYFGSEMALTATVLLTFNFFHILYSKEARPYSLYILLTIISLYYFIKILRNTYSLNNRVKLFIVNALMYWTHPVSIFFIVAEYLFLYLNLIFKEKNITVKFLLNVLVKSFLIEVILFLTFISVRLNIFTNHILYSWIWKPEIFNLMSVYSAMLQYSYIVTAGCLDCNSMLIYKKLSLYILFIFLFLISIFIFSKKKCHFTRENKIFFYFLSVVVFVLPVMIFLISQFRPFLNYRYLSFMFIPLILIISFILSLPNKKLRYIILLLIGSIAMYSAFQSLKFNSVNPSYDQLFEHLKETDQKAILVIGEVYLYSDFMLEYYRNNKKFNYDNVISFDEISQGMSYDGYLYIKTWFLEFVPIHNERYRFFENNLVNNNCDFVNYELEGTKLLSVRKILC